MGRHDAVGSVDEGEARGLWYRHLRVVSTTIALLLLVMGSLIGCPGPDVPTGEPRLVLTPFRQQGFGTGQVPIIVVAQVSGRLTRTHCVFFEMQFANANSIRLFYFSGEEVPPDTSDFTTDQQARCLRFNTSCLFGQISRKNNEFVLQADLTGKTGGLLVASLYDRDCRRETQRITLQTLAIGNSLFRDETAFSEPVADGGVTADGGAGE